MGAQTDRLRHVGGDGEGVGLNGLAVCSTLGLDLGSGIFESADFAD